MLLLVMVLAGCLAGVGLLLVVRGAMTPAPPLADVVQDLHRPRMTVRLSRRDRFDASMERFALLGVTNRADLEVCERTPAKFTSTRITWAVLFAAPGLLGLALGPLHVVTWLSMPMALLAAVRRCGGGLVLRPGRTCARMRRRPAASSCRRWRRTSIWCRS